MGLMVEIAQGLLLVIALLWTGGNDRMIFVLTGAFIGAIAAASTLTGLDRDVAMSVLDAAIVAYASRIWVNEHDLRGWWIGWLGLIKLGWRFGYASHPTVSHFWFAFAINGAFVAQVIIAGGMLDGLGRRLADHLRSAGPRGARLLRNVEGR